MADLFDPTSCPSPSPQQPTSPPQTTSFTLESDDISSLLNTLLHNSSHPSTSSTTAHLTPPLENRRQFPGSAVFSETSVLLNSPSGLNFPFSGAFYASSSTERAENAFSGSIALSMEGIGDIDCESEEQEEALMNRTLARTSSKRSRAAEVHNLSEKRRRQRINEKMKALQKLIPNSNKTDKASMLDEAIEYLKQLQVQVQMLSMRNGSSLHPFYFQGIAQTVQVPQAASLLEEGNSSREVGSFPANQEASMQAMFDLSSKTAPSDYKLLLTRMSENGNSGPSFVLEPSTNAHYRSINASIPSKVLCEDPSVPQLQLDMSHCGQSSSSRASS